MTTDGITTGRIDITAAGVSAAFAFRANDGREVFHITADGRAVVNPEFTVDEAARAFWDAVQKLARPKEARATSHYPGERIPYVKVTRPDTSGEKYGCYWPIKAFSAADEFDGAESGERIVLVFCTLTQAEVEAMPEFGGW